VHRLDRLILVPFAVFKGMRMAGRMGGEQVTVHNLKVVGIIADSNLLLLKGSVPARSTGTSKSASARLNNLKRKCAAMDWMSTKRRHEERRESEALRRHIRIEPNEDAMYRAFASTWTTSGRGRPR